MTNRQWLCAGLLGLLAASAPVGSSAQAQAYPAGPVKIITQIAAGNGADVALRVVAGHLGEMWGQQVLVLNQPAPED